MGNGRTRDFGRCEISRDPVKAGGVLECAALRLPVELLLLVREAPQGVARAASQLLLVRDGLQRTGVGDGGGGSEVLFCTGAASSSLVLPLGSASVEGETTVIGFGVEGSCCRSLSAASSWKVARVRSSCVAGSSS